MFLRKEIMVTQKLMISLEEIKDDKVFRFEFPMGVTYQDSYDACIACANQIVEMSKIAAAQQEEKVVGDDAVVEEVPEKVEE